MARTIPNKVPQNWPKGTYRVACDYCGAAYMRHQLRRNESGYLACPDDRKGKDEVQLNRINAELSPVNTKSIQTDGGQNPEQATLSVIHRTTAADILLR